MTARRVPKPVPGVPPPNKPVVIRLRNSNNIKRRLWHSGCYSNLTISLSGGAMAKIERVREELSSPPTPDYWKQRTGAGWRLAAVEWAREAQSEKPSEPAEEIPYGLKIGDDCMHLEVKMRPSARLCC